MSNKEQTARMFNTVHRKYKLKQFQSRFASHNNLSRFCNFIIVTLTAIGK